MARFITPNTLFGDKFAQYLEEGGGSDDLVAKYGG